MNCLQNWDKRKTWTFKKLNSKRMYNWPFNCPTFKRYICRRDCFYTKPVYYKEILEFSPYL